MPAPVPVLANRIATIAIETRFKARKSYFGINIPVYFLRRLKCVSVAIVAILLIGTGTGAGT